MQLDWTGIDHVTKVDPEKAMPSDPASLLAATDLVMVGGSDGVTEENTIATIEAVRDAAPDVPIFQEPYNADQVTKETVDAVDVLSVPAVYNGDMKHFVGKHVSMYAQLASKPSSMMGTSLPVVGSVIESKAEGVVADLTEKIVGEGYVIQHTDSAAARTAGATEPFTTEEVAGAALATETFYGFPIFYVEYSGTYGGPADVEAAAAHLEDTVLLYGGGIDSREKAEEILDAGADAVVVGDCFHDDREKFTETIPRR
ncbi:geranylgeranylglyceryl phosphate synthase-like protein [Halovivax asiaticus JCM 14624]|uniref:Geranylgeranylglyceryl phosphate synthase n=1 Tax=Halovivax asiaticus JCM 14624 TaxID=1227490 RepID=M0BI19_9EURY|nr:heptaprenylglyceryl phosphate synthase [Halovivax asiaticus]ELZ10112.1 geranylgeranylglyceryl phosphate synthase-like protein [Halovivax asiaticus JCM 14624]